MVAPDHSAVDWILVINIAPYKGQHIRQCTPSENADARKRYRKTKSISVVSSRQVEVQVRRNLRDPFQELNKLQLDKTFPHSYDLAYFVGMRPANLLMIKQLVAIPKTVFHRIEG